ncbi:MAG: phosphoglycerate dehydrogenase [Chitinophagales bacterium]
MTGITSYPKEKIRILLLENIAEDAVKQFERSGYTQIERWNKSPAEKDLLKAIRQVHLLGIRSKTQITEQVLRSAKQLLALGCYCIGTNQVDLRSAGLMGIPVFNSPFPNTRSVAELVIAASILLLRRVPEKNTAAHAGIWMKKAEHSFELRGKTLGIIGYGNIGMQVSVLAEALGMRVLYYDIETKLPMGNARQIHTLRSLLGQADVITLHVPGDASTEQLLDKTTIAQMKKGAVVINYARGKVVDHEALAKALRSGKLGGAAIDVFPVEPFSNGDTFQSVLQNIPNVLLTPHIGGSTEEAQKNISDDVTNKLIQFLEYGISSGSHSVPALHLPPQKNRHRILHIHQNVPGVLSEITHKLAAEKINISGQFLNTNNLIGYVVIDVDKNASATALRSLKTVKNTIKTRLLY